MNVVTGLTGVAELEVGPQDTARALRSGDVDVLGTPRLVALCEEATMRCLNGSVNEGSSSVCVRVQIDHLAPTPLGAHVVAEAHLEKVEGRRMIFTVSAKDERGLVAAGKVTRVLVDVDRFMEKTRSI